MKAARIDKNGFPVAFFTPDVHEGFIEEDGTHKIDPKGPLKDCIPMDDQDWHDHIHGKLRRWDRKLKKWVPTDPPAPTYEEALSSLRRQRDIKLKQTDWTQLPDSPLSASERKAWAKYRQALRDLPGKLTKKQVITGKFTWPEPPTKKKA